MLAGFGMIVLGYIGCFSVVQDPRSTTTDIYTWLGLEFTLALIRIGIWGWNPTFDDPDGLYINMQRTAALPIQPRVTINEAQTVRIMEETTFWEELTAFSGLLDIPNIPRIAGYEYWYAWVKKDGPDMKTPVGNLCIVLKGTHRILCMLGHSSTTGALQGADELTLHQAHLVETPLRGNSVQLPRTNNSNPNLTRFPGLTSQVKEAVFDHYYFIEAARNTPSDAVTIKISWLLSDSLSVISVSVDP